MKSFFLALSFLTVGIVSGYFLGLSFSTKPVSVGNVARPEQNINAVENGLIKSTTVHVEGLVEGVKDNGVTLVSGSEKLTFTVPEETPITRIKTILASPDEETGSGEQSSLPRVESENITVAEIKVGERISASLNRVTSKDYSALNITVFEEVK